MNPCIPELPIIDVCDAAERDPPAFRKATGFNLKDSAEFDIEHVSSMLLQLHGQDKSGCQSLLLKLRDFWHENTADKENKEHLNRLLLQTGLTVTLATILTDEDTYTQELLQDPPSQSEEISQNYFGTTLYLMIQLAEFINQTTQLDATDPICMPISQFRSMLPAMWRKIWEKRSLLCNQQMCYRARRDSKATPIPLLLSFLASILFPMATNRVKYEDSYEIALLYYLWTLGFTGDGSYSDDCLTMANDWFMGLYAEAKGESFAATQHFIQTIWPDSQIANQFAVRIRNVLIEKDFLDVPLISLYGSLGIIFLHRGELEMDPTNVDNSLEISAYSKVGFLEAVIYSCHRQYCRGKKALPTSAGYLIQYA
ncbi:hypothetical protein K474DRAFT_1498420 [Panus rudis PR-1116 ss-1]|nr:hypothetical protein K474DRAFT_1498420 [Panus rudis PR-1116 ss-1]